MSEALIEAMAKVVELDPSNDAIRLRLGEMLISGGRADEALLHAKAILAATPDHRSALRLAAEASQAAGLDDQGAAYQRLYEVLGSNLVPSLSAEKSTVVREVDIISRPTSPAAQDEWEANPSDVRLADVAGLHNVKRRLELTFLGPMRNEEMRRAFGQTMRGGLLLYGPPGCGKTYLARAIAGELGASFLSVGLSEVLDMWIGSSEKRLHAAFEAARKKRPSVLFFDELDAIGRKRSLSRDHAGRGLINQLLAEMDGINADNEGVFILGATNHPWDIDAALRRPGRFDRMVLVSPPDAEARRAIVETVLASRPTRGIDTKWLAEQTVDFSGADVRHLCDTAAEFALADSVEAGSVLPIEARHLKLALKEVRPSMRSWLESAKNYALFSNDGGEYDELLVFLKGRRIV